MTQDVWVDLYYEIEVEFGGPVLVAQLRGQDPKDVRNFDVQDITTDPEAKKRTVRVTASVRSTT